MRIIVAGIVTVFLCVFANGKVYINIGAPEKAQKSLIALSSFVHQDQQPNSREQFVAKQMSERLSKNLKFSSYFNVLQPQAFIEDPSTLAPVPYTKNSQGFRWQNWKLIGADFLLFTHYSIKGKELFLDVHFYNVNLQKLLFWKKYTGQVNQSSKMVDKLSNEIVKRLSGKNGIFETKILAVRNTSSTKKELFVMDWNGQNQKRVTYHRSIVMSPVWSDSGYQTSYSAFVYNKKLRKTVVALFVYNFKTNKIRLLSAKNGANLGSDFFPGDRQMLVTSKGKGFLDIFKLDLKSMKFTALTHGPRGRIYVEPSIHPKTRQIVFSSDKNGKTMIYTMNSRGKNVRQVTFAGHHNATPDWHPEKNEIVFSGMDKGRMDLFRISSRGTGLKRLTSLRKVGGGWANCESPSFSPNGQFVVFSSDVSGTYQLYVMNLDDQSIERITFDRHQYKSPKWSPYL